MNQNRGARSAPRDQNGKLRFFSSVPTRRFTDPASVAFENGAWPREECTKEISLIVQ
ncbi:hypothetical protein [Pseudorhodoferax sp. Leaf265]|uniref:hypothetical protein n=1 Tax=Pseudorhodoferax sp. Leaf265 TaxID=1736315 RepID=UPI0012E775A0|nr:hypothetical protein [Pseudorhodoferax sp. Leaf265]